MSASSKKKLRNEQEAAKMTERQLNEQKEAKQLKLYTTIFTVALAAIILVAVVTGVMQTITSSGVREKNTVALTVGERELSNAELNYYFIDAVNEFYNYYGSYAAMFGLDVTTPLDQQIVDKETGSTWADDFTQTAISNAQSTIALANEAKAAGYELPEDDAAAIENNIATMQTYAAIYGYANAEDYLKAAYGKGATIDSYRAYCEELYLANSYYNHYNQSLIYEDADLRAAEKENFDQYSAYSYNYYYMPVSSFLEGGTENEDGTFTYSDEERAGAVKAAKAAAKKLTGEEITDLAALDAAISALSINADAETPVVSTSVEDVMYNSVLSTVSEWVTASARKAGDLTYIANESTTTDAEGNEKTNVNGYYVVYFQGKNDNTFGLANVRHILIGFEGGTYDEATGTTTYSPEEKTDAKLRAEEILDAYTSGKKTENAFASLATEHTTDPGSKENGGLYEDIYPGQMVEAFNDWCFDSARKTGDTGLVETEYGYHVMYYVGESETTYRDYLIENALRAEDSSEWYNALVEAMTVAEGDTQHLSRDLTLSNG